MRMVVAAAVAVAVVALGAVLLIDGDDDREPTVEGPAGHGFSLLKPDGWEEVDAAEREQLPGQPLAVLRLGQGDGLVTVNAPAGTERDLDAVARRLNGRLKKALPDFRQVSARVVEVKAGRALLYSYARTKRATAHSLLVVPTQERTYTVNAVVPAGAEDAARDVGRILLSFDI